MAYNFALDTSLLLTEELHNIEDNARALEREREEFAVLNKTFVQAFSEHSALPKPVHLTYHVNGEGNCVLQLGWGLGGWVEVAVRVRPNEVHVMYEYEMAEALTRLVIFTAPFDKQAIENEIMRRIKCVNELVHRVFPPEMVYPDNEERDSFANDADAPLDV